MTLQLHISRMIPWYHYCCYPFVHLFDKPKYVNTNYIVSQILLNTSISKMSGISRHCANECIPSSSFYRSTQFGCTRTVKELQKIERTWRITQITFSYWQILSKSKEQLFELPRITHMRERVLKIVQNTYHRLASPKDVLSLSLSAALVPCNGSTVNNIGVTG